MLFARENPVALMQRRTGDVRRGVKNGTWSSLRAGTRSFNDFSKSGHTYSMRSPFRMFARNAPAPAAPVESLRVAAREEPPFAGGLWPYSRTYVEIVDEGHQRPPPSFGTPTLVWHLGIWPKAIGGDLDPRAARPDLELRDRIDIYEDNNREFFKEVSAILLALQGRGRVVGTTPRGLKIGRPHLAAANVHAFELCEPQSLTFTLWWQDAAGPRVLNAPQDTPAPGDLRVRVQAQTHLDHATLSFFIDAGKAWNERRIHDAQAARGTRRRAIFDHIATVKSICARQIAAGRVDFDRIPEAGVHSDEARRLLAAASYCYDEIWREFAAAFGLGSLVSFDSSAQSSIAEVFASFRSLVIAADGLPTPAAERRAADTVALRRKVGLGAAAQGGSATTGIGTFDAFDPASGEPNTILKAYWPFIRRVTPGADDRDFVACGVFDWRALFVTSLGSRIEAVERDEADNPAALVPNDAVPPVDTSERGLHAPVYQLFLTKGEPHRQQIGRIVERANAVGTMRLYALRNWATIRNAGIHIRLVGDQLDGVLSDWSKTRQKIDQLHPLALAEPQDDAGLLYVDTPATQRVKDRRIRALNKLIRETEAKLIQLGADLDGIGQGGSGRLLYVINRSKHFIDEFRRLIDTLKIDNIPTWTTYEQFVDRGLAPTFESIRTTGERLTSLRDRLQAVTGMVQTGALIVETEATENNTQMLRRLATNWNAVEFGMYGVLSTIIVQVFLTIVDHAFDAISDTAKVNVVIVEAVVFVGLLVSLLFMRRWIFEKSKNM